MTLFSGNNQQQQVGEQWLMVVVVLGVGCWVDFFYFYRRSVRPGK